MVRAAAALAALGILAAGCAAPPGPTAAERATARLGRRAAPARERPVRAEPPPADPVGVKPFVPDPDPSKNEVPVPALGGWEGTLVYDNDVGVWTVESFQVFPEFGCPEIVGLDDRGRCTVASSYSGKWYRYDTIGEGKWLGGLEFVDLDPRVPGAELYTGGEKGNLYRVVAHSPGIFSVDLLASLPGREIHTLVGGDLDPSRPGNEMVMFTRPGGLYLVVPEAGPGTGFSVTLLEDIGGRVRDAILLPSSPGGVPEIATAARSGAVELLRLTPGGPRWTTLCARAMGFGRLALAPAAPGRPTVLYATCDDGIVVRLERTPSGPWKEEVVYAGPQGPRGLVAGRFDADPAKETLAVFGYGKRVQLLTRERDGWRADTIFEDRDKGHWMCRAEVDGRNATDEIVVSGYGSRVVLLSRPAGYGLEGVATDPEAPAKATTMAQ